VKHLDQFDASQGKDKDDRTYGYGGIEDRGGYFFTWLPTLQETLDSIEADEIDPPQNWPQRAMAELRGCIRRRWAKERSKVNSLVPSA